MIKCLYEVVNPSDPCVIAAEGETQELCDGIATAVTTLMGRGQYCPKSEAGNAVSPFFMFMGDGSCDAWFKDRFEVNLGGFIEKYALPIAECCESATVISIGQYKALFVAFEGMPEEEKQRRLQVFNEERRSSMNNLCGYARQIGIKIRDRFGLPAKPGIKEKQIGAPQSVFSLGGSR